MARVHLSFDNGPHPEGTPAVLRVLAAHGATASFFVLGQHLAEPWGAALARELVAAGHRLGHHSWSHTVPLGEDPRPEAISRELQATHERLRGLWSGPRWFRPFGGGGHIGPHLLSPAAVEWLEDHDYTVVLWNSVPRDWEDPAGWVDRALAEAAALDAAARARGEAEAEVVVVLHDIVPAAMAGLDGFLHRLAAGGHRLTDALPAAVVPLSPAGRQPALAGMVQEPGG